MNYGLYLSAMGLKAQQVRQDVIANNLANAQTAGFKRDLLAMQARANAVDEDPRVFGLRVPVVDDQGGGVFAVGQGIDLSQGMLQETGNRTDLALQGPGFFTVGGNGGQERLLTRDGRFLVDSQGTLRMAANGRPVLDSRGSAITVNPNLPVTITSTGEVVQGDLLGGGAGGGVKLGIVDVKNPKQLQKLGENLLRARNDADLVEANPATQVRAGAIEASGVEPTTEMIHMIEGYRAFEANAKMISMQDQTLAQVNTIGRVA